MLSWIFGSKSSSEIPIIYQSNQKFLISYQTDGAFEAVSFKYD